MVCFTSLLRGNRQTSLKCVEGNRKWKETGSDREHPGSSPDCKLFVYLNILPSVLWCLWCLSSLLSPIGREEEENPTTNVWKRKFLAFILWARSNGFIVNNVKQETQVGEGETRLCFINNSANIYMSRVFYYNHNRCLTCRSFYGQQIKIQWEFWLGSKIFYSHETKGAIKRLQQDGNKIIKTPSAGFCPLIIFVETRAQQSSDSPFLRQLPSHLWPPKGKTNSNKLRHS